MTYQGEYRMGYDNVCKFNINRSSDLICLNFISEKREAQSSEQIAEHHAVNLVMSGTGYFNKNGVEYNIKPGDLFFVREGDNFSVRSESSLEYSYICFRGRRADEFISRFGLNRSNTVFCDCDSLIPFWQRSHDLSNDDNIDIVCEAVLLYSLAMLDPAKKETSDVISKVVTITQKNFTDPDLSISAVADELGYDPKYLSSLFKKKRGLPYTQYLREQRVKHAIFLMEQGVVSVKNVAILSGFRDALYFSKIFAASEGISPKAYIQKLSDEIQ